MARAVAGARTTVTSVRRLHGGIDSTTHLVSFDRGAPVVLKRASGREPSGLVSEHARLQVARDVDVPSPDPIALDEAGEWFGCPALVMSRLRGSVVWHDAGGSWIDELVATLVAVHRHAVPDDVPAVLRAPHAGLAWRPNLAALPRTDRFERLVAMALDLQATLRDAEQPARLLHHDFYHRNVLWHRGRVSGVVDWNESRLGPPVCDVAYTSIDIAMTAGPAMADRFVDAYEAESGRLADVRRWQALWIAAQIPWLHLWHGALRPKQAEQVTLPSLRWRLARLADRVLADA